MTNVDVLRALMGGRELLDAGNSHAKGALARDAQGAAVDPCGPEAVCFCVMGAVVRAADDNAEVWKSALCSLRMFVDAAGQCRDVIGFNDAAMTAHADVLALFDRTIAAEEARMSTNERLAARGLRAVKVGGHASKRSIQSASGRVVFVGDAHETTTWLNAGMPATEATL